MPTPSVPMMTVNLVSSIPEARNARTVPTAITA